MRGQHSSLEVGAAAPPLARCAREWRLATSPNAAERAAALTVPLQALAFNDVAESVHGEEDLVGKVRVRPNGTRAIGGALGGMALHQRHDTRGVERRRAQLAVERRRARVRWWRSPQDVEAPSPIRFPRTSLRSRSARATWTARPTCMSASRSALRALWRGCMRSDLRGGLRALIREQGNDFCTRLLRETDVALPGLSCCIFDCRSKGINSGCGNII